ncbi:MAG: polyprenyl synthetase family protein [Verrucomicrobia bacterium]|nr:MAG: polyprenyl synthetase family protein [Verrucomicrobiota bacterium]
MLAADSKAESVTMAETLNTEPIYSWKQIIEPVEPFLETVSRRLMKEANSFDPAILPYADYALNGHGKQLRPALVALTANALGKTHDAHATVAVIIEMVHLATLVHDDVMDEAEIRRGRLTLSANWGNEIAVLFGDCLFANALRLAASFPSPDICRAVAAATNTVCAGEIFQTQHRRDFQFTREKYFRALEMKTAELFALSCELSAMLSGASAEERTGFRQFGLALGTAYQVYDDCVDLFGTEATAGKSLGTDLAKGKLTLPVLLLWERANAADRASLEGLVQDWKPCSMDRLARLLAKYELLPASLQFAHQYLEKAAQTLRSIPAASGQSGLMGVITYLARQVSGL